MIDADRGNNTFPLHSNRAVYGSEFATQAYSIISDANSTVHRINDDSTDDSIDNSTNDSTDDLSTDDTYYYYGASDDDISDDDASQRDGVSFSVTSNTLTNIDFYGPHFNLQFGVSDFYGNRINAIIEENSFLKNVITTVILNLTSAECGSDAAFTFGDNLAQFSANKFSFPFLEVHCTPGGSVDVKVFPLTSSLQSSVGVKLLFRLCRRGEIYTSGRCIECPSGFYSLNANTNNTVTSCQKCPSGSKTCFRDVIVTDAGYWRGSSDAHTLLRCPFGSQSCKETRLYGDSACSTGYEG